MGRLLVGLFLLLLSSGPALSQDAGKSPGQCRALKDSFQPHCERNGGGTHVLVITEDAGF